MGRGEFRLRILIILLLMIPVAYALDECQRVQDPGDIPCNIVSTWSGTDCVSTISIFNESEELIGIVSWGNHTPYCNFTWNYSGAGTYTYNSTIEDGVITVAGGKMWLLGILLIPLGLAFLFLYWGATLQDEQEPLKWFMRLLALVMIFVLFAAANMVINLNPGYSVLLALFNFTWITWVFWGMLALFLVYFLYRIGLAMRDKANDDFKNGIIK